MSVIDNIELEEIRDKTYEIVMLGKLLGYDVNYFTNTDDCVIVKIEKDNKRYLVVVSQDGRSIWTGPAANPFVTELKDFEYIKSLL